MNPIKKAILPVAGLGTRVMPLTLHQPKGMIAIADKPMIHYVVDEMLSAGFKEIVFILGHNQDVFRNYIEHTNKNQIWNDIKFHFIYQNGPFGNGDAVYAAKTVMIPGEAFLVAFSDDIFVKKPYPAKQLSDLFRRTGEAAILLETVPRKKVDRYGVVKTEPGPAENVLAVTDIVEKPKPSQAPSNLTVVGRYVFTYEIFKYLEKLYPYQGREIYLTDAIKLFLNDGHKVLGTKLNGFRFDCGSKEGLVQAQAYFAFHHPQFKHRVRKLLL